MAPNRVLVRLLFTPGQMPAYLSAGLTVGSLVSHAGEEIPPLSASYQKLVDTDSVSAVAIFHDLVASGHHCADVDFNPYRSRAGTTWDALTITFDVEASNFTSLDRVRRMTLVGNMAFRHGHVVRVLTPDDGQPPHDLVVFVRPSESRAIHTLRCVNREFVVESVEPPVPVAVG